MKLVVKANQPVSQVLIQEQQLRDSLSELKQLVVKQKKPANEL